MIIIFRAGDTVAEKYVEVAADSRHIADEVARTIGA